MTVKHYIYPSNRKNRRYCFMVCEPPNCLSLIKRVSRPLRSDSSSTAITVEDLSREKDRTSTCERETYESTISLSREYESYKDVYSRGQDNTLG